TPQTDSTFDLMEPLITTIPLPSSPWFAKFQKHKRNSLQLSLNLFNSNLLVDSHHFPDITNCKAKFKKFFKPWIRNYDTTHLLTSFTRDSSRTAKQLKNLMILTKTSSRKLLRTTIRRGTEHDLVEGTVIPEKISTSPRGPSGITTVHRDGTEYNVDIQMRVVEYADEPL
ncbi:2715_t:CDS:2, partial [Paraglomus occultum]